jgi:putative glutamine amidotransferase
MQPIIGIFAEIDAEATAKLQNTYVKAIEKSGGIPLLLPYVQGDATIARFVSLCDGFCFTGGADIDPTRYGEDKRATCEEVQYHRDDLEFRALHQVLKTEKPILAICRGAQLINVAFGGTLYQDIPSETPTHVLHRRQEDKYSLFHTVKVLADTPLRNLVQTEQICVNSFHHQAVKKLGAGLEIMAVADDGMAEAFYGSEKRYLRAYQWHPERLFDLDESHRVIFEDFVKACQG